MSRWPRWPRISDRISTGKSSKLSLIIDIDIDFDF